MKRMLITFTAVVCLMAAVGSQAGPSEDLAKQTRDAFNAELRAVRPDHLLLPLNYLEVGGHSYGYHLPRRFERLARAGESFRIRKLKRKGREYRVEMESGSGARIRLRIFDAGNEVTQELLDQVFPRFLADVFVFGEAPAAPRIVVNTQSGLAHRGSCNHLPPVDLRHPAESLEGVRACPACFPTDPPLPYDGYMATRMAATEEARLFLLAFPPVDDADRQARVATCGRKVVESLPMASLDFDYEFGVVHSNLMQAVSFPTGFVYVTDRLLDAVESEAELAFVLAHEVAHCELFLPPVRQPDESVPGTVEAVLGRAAAARSREIQADIVATGTVACLYGADAAGASLSILHKLQFANEAVPQATARPLDTHPPLGERVAFFERDGFFYVASGPTFQGLDDEGEVLITARVLGGSFSPSGSELLYLLMEASDLANKDFTVAHLDRRYDVGRIWSESGRGYPLQNRFGDYRIPSGMREIVVLNVLGVNREKYGASPVADAYELDLGRLSRLEIFKLSDVDRWIPAQVD